jgi:hypothetical protein
MDTLARSNIKTAELLTTLTEIAYLDPAECFDVDTPPGQRETLKTVKEMAPHMRRAVASM